MVLRHRTASTLLVFVCLLLFVACVQEKKEEPLSIVVGNEQFVIESGLQDEEKEHPSTTNSDFSSMIPDYERLQRSGTPFEYGIIWEKDIEWLSFSSTDFEEERTMIKECLIDEIAVIKDFRPWFSPAIPISKYDINNDQKDEAIALLDGTDGTLSGTHDKGVFYVFYFEGNAIVSYIKIGGFPLNKESLVGSNRFGVIFRSEGTCDLFIENRLYVWDGNGW